MTNQTTVSPAEHNINRSASAFTNISSGRKAKNTIATILIYGCMLLALVPLVWVPVSYTHLTLPTIYSV